MALLLDPEWVERATLAAERVKRRCGGAREIREQIEREAVGSRTCVRDEAPVRRPAPPPAAVSEPAAPTPAVVAKKLPPVKGQYGYSSTRILKVLQAFKKPQSSSVVCDLLPDMKRTSVQAFLAGFRHRKFATRSGEEGAYLWALGPRGKTYLENFGPLD